MLFSGNQLLYTVTAEVVGTIGLFVYLLVKRQPKTAVKVLVLGFVGLVGLIVVTYFLYLAWFSLLTGY